MNGSEQYIRALWNGVKNWTIVGDTAESPALQLTFKNGDDNLFFASNDYSAAVWETMRNQMAGESFDEDNLATIKLFFDNKQGWFNIDAIYDYANSFWNVCNCIIELEAEPTSRRAVIRLPDGACLLSVQFVLRDECLYTYANFRSLDLVKGAPTDVYVLQRLTDMVANVLQPKSRLLVVDAACPHVYLTDVKRVSDAHNDLEKLT